MPMPPLDPAWRARQRHQPFFCEENVWQLLRGDALPRPAAAVFITNADKTVAMWGQRATRVDPLVWDYHVVALLPGPGLIVDLDDREQAVWPVAAWLPHAFAGPVEAALRPGFRIVPAGEFLAVFSSDRSHMRDERGRERQPFPDWPAPWQPGRGMNLSRFLDLQDPIAGLVTDADGLSRWRG